MGYGKEYGALLEAIAKEADAIAMRYFRADELRIERKGDGTAVTQADRAVEEMARAKVAASGLPLDVLGEEMGGGDAQSASASGRARMIIDPIDGTEEFSRGIPTFGTLMGIERNGDGERARSAFALVGVSRRGRVPGWQAAPCLERDYAEQGDGVYDGNGPEQERPRPGENPRAAGRGAQQPLVWRILAAHASRGRSDRGCP